VASSLLIACVEALTAKERRQIMGNRGNVYERYYMPNFVDKDVHAIFIGIPRRNDLIRAVGRLERHKMALDRLNEAQQKEVTNDPKLVPLTKRRDELKALVKSEGYPTMKAAHGTDMFVEYGEKNREINNLKTKLTRVKLEQVIDKFHETVHTQEVNRQVQGILPVSELLNPPTFAYELDKRATVAQLLFQPLDEVNIPQIFCIRMQLVEALTGLCMRRETPHQFRKSKKMAWPAGAIDTAMDLDPPVPSATQLPVDVVVHEAIDYIPGDAEPQDVKPMVVLCCPFCKVGGEEVPPGMRDHVYARPDSLGRHIRVQHLADQDASEDFDCPYEDCSAFLGTTMHFFSHAARQYNLTLWSSRA
jgi:hypothetical protein